MTENKTDITNADHIKVLVDSFYKSVNSDNVLGPIFSHVDWPQHLPVMYSFWGSMLLGEGTYRGNPFQKHVPLPLKPEHFNRWLQLWKQTVDTHFSGFNAEEAKQRASSIADVFQYRLGLKHRS